MVGPESAYEYLRTLDPPKAAEITEIMDDVMSAIKQ